MAKRLGIWLGGVHVADLEQRRWPELRCHYTEEALERWPLNSPVLSCSLPLEEEVVLAPLYDTVPTVLWPKLRRESAMAIGGQPVLADVTVADLVREAGIWRHPAERARRVVGETVETILAATEEDAVIDSQGRLAEAVRSRGSELLAGMTG